MNSNVSLVNPTNRKDPLLAGPDAGRALFDMMQRAANGFDRDAVISAAVNILVNAVRQECNTRAAAEVKYDELAAKTKGLLMAHYDAASGKRRSVFPFTQHIQAVRVDDKDGLR